MKNTIASFRLVVRPDPKSQQIANDIRKLNSNMANPLVEADDADLVIAIGGDGTFIHAVTDTGFSKEKIYKTSFSKYGTAYEKLIFPQIYINNSQLEKEITVHGRNI